MTELPNFNRKTYKETDDYKIYLEEIGDDVYIHVAIYRSTPSVIKEIIEQWKEVVVRMYFLGYEKLYAYTKDNRIVKLIGHAKKLTEYEDYEVWVWDLS